MHATGAAGCVAVARAVFSLTSVQWNRDIAALVHKAGLQIVEHTTHNLGTTHVIVARRGTEQ